MKLCNLFQCIFARLRNSPALLSSGKVKRPRPNRWVAYFNQTCTTTCTSAVYEKQRLESLGFNFLLKYILDCVFPSNQSSEHGIIRYMA